MNGPIDFAEINRAALAAFPAVLARILPGGKRIGAEIVALNPRRADRQLGSFKVNRYNGRWADFATGDKGGDPISLVAYLADVSQGEAARLLARMLGIEAGGPRHGLTASISRPCLTPNAKRRRKSRQRRAIGRGEARACRPPTPKPAEAAAARLVRPSAG